MHYAFLVGINYKGTTSELNGCINDVHSLKDLLINKFNYNKDNIVILTDDEPLKPTKNNILRTFIDLARKAIKGELTNLFFHYSGHGYYVEDYNNEETDNYDEVLCPLDYEINGFISDDILNMIFRVFPSSCNIFTLMDCCHSGTILDLKYKYFDETEKICNNKNVKANIVMISGCRDSQTSADAYLSGKYCGAMTNAFLHTLKNYDYNISYFELLKNMRDIIKKNKFSQIPQLTSSNIIQNSSLFCRSIEKKPFIEYH